MEKEEVLNPREGFGKRHHIGRYIPGDAGGSKAPGSSSSRVSVKGAWFAFPQGRFCQVYSETGNGSWCWC